MKLDFLPTQSRQKYLVWAFLVVLFIGGALVWFGYFKEETISIFQGNSPPPPRDILLDFTVFENPTFQELGAPVSEILVPEILQRQNPFTPITPN